MPKLDVNYQTIIRKYPIISEQITQKKLEVILFYLAQVIKADIPGDIVEMGCYIGTTSLFLQRLLSENYPAHPRQLHVYDSFDGLPHKSFQDASVSGTNFKAGELKASKKQLVKNFKKANLPIPKIHKAWFEDLKSKDIPDKIAFAFLDGDFYNSILTSLNLVWNTISSEGGIVIIDDYNRSDLPGVNRALEEFNKYNDLSYISKNNLAILFKQ